MKAFNLLDEPFIFAHFIDGSVKELSILDVFDNAKQITRIGGDSTHQEFAFVRILLAILYRALSPQDRSDWKDLWNEGIPQDTLRAYLEKHRERFYLIHPETPFYQIVGAEYEKANPDTSFLNAVIDMQYAVQKAKTDRFLFSTLTYGGVRRISYAQATRKLIELQNFNTASKKSTIKGDDRTKKKNFAQPGWAGTMTGIVVQGVNFEQTLLLNLVPYEFLELDSEIDIPVWERTQQTSQADGVHGEMDESRLPTGPADVYTHQISRVSLIASDDHISGAVVGVGDRIFVYDKHRIEPMSTWRTIVRDKSKQTVYRPVKMPIVESWRGLGSILAVDQSKAAKGSTQQIAKNLEWFGAVSRTVQEELGYIAKLVTFTTEYGEQDAKITRSSVSSFALPSEVFLANNPTVLQSVMKAIDTANEFANAVFWLRADIIVAQGKERQPLKGVSAYDLAMPIKDTFLLQAGQLFQQWVVTVNSSNYQDRHDEWREQLRQLTRDMARDCIEGASPRAINGVIEGENQMNLFIAKNKFDYTIRKLMK